MNDKINIGEVTVAEFNIIMKQLAVGQLGECIDLFMKLRQIGQDFQAAQQQPMVAPPAEEQAE
jgi:hypothetical protein